MTDYSHILVAVDLSDESGAIVEKAGRLAKTYGADITLVHVLEYQNLTYIPDFPVPEDLELEQRLLESARSRIESMARKLDRESVETYVELGSPQYEISELAEKLGIDLIIIGSHGRHGLQLLLGSTANGVLHMAPCDVLAVRMGD